MASTLSDPVASPAGAYAARRRDLLGTREGPGPARRKRLAELTDGWLQQVFAEAVAGVRETPAAVALVAVGGYGRAELSPGSDLDLLLLHAGRGDVTGLAERIWYPVWDAGVRLDHSVRTPDQARRLAGEDLAVLLGLVDARHLAGDPGLTARLRSSVLSDWRASARRRLPELRDAWEERGARHGDVRHDLEPDLKEGRGGLRDLVSLRAVTAAWVADRPHRDLDAAVQRLADVREALHQSTGRAGNRLVLQEQDRVARLLGRAGPDALLREVAGSAAAVTHAAEVTWRRALQATRGRTSRYLHGRRPVLRPLGPGLAEHDGEVVLTAQAAPTSDPLLVLRLAARAARAGLPVASSSLDGIAAGAPALPEPWPGPARDLFVELLGAGPSLVPVWEALDQAGLVTRLLPEWARVRHLPQRNAVHRFTVDRHLVEAAVRAAPLVREVRRPDLLLVGALLHDIGKGGAADHREAGAGLAASAASRMGFPDADVDVVERLVRHHLLLVQTATRRDLEDPVTAAAVAQRLGCPEVLRLLHALTLADARATGPAAWSGWKAGLVQELVRRVEPLVGGAPTPAVVAPAPPRPTLPDRGEPAVVVEPADAGTWTVTVVAPDRPGLFAGIAGVLALHRLPVRAAQVGTDGGVASDVWTVGPDPGHEPRADVLARDVARAMAQALDLTPRLAARDANRTRPRVSPPPPRVDLVTDASDTATVVEVRAADRPGLLYSLGRALTLMGVGIRAARVVTIGAEAIDVFYLTTSDGGPLDAAAAREAARLLTDAAGPPDHAVDRGTSPSGD